jgi:hypothetical protein
MRRLPPVRAIVFVLAACVGCTSTGPSANPSSAAGTASTSASVSLEPVQGLEIIEPAWSADGSDWFLDLSWEVPVGASVDHYEVSRDGIVVQEDLVVTSWTDPAVEPRTRYVYEVLAIDAAGTSGPPASVSIVTGAPPLSQARLEGAFIVAMRVQNSRGIDDPVEDGDLVFRFRPRCAGGPCAVAWTVASHPSTAILARRGAVYRRRARTPFLIRDCFGRTNDEALVVRIRVREAAAIDGDWRAQDISGAIRESSRSPGCGAASIRWFLRGQVEV